MKNILRLLVVALILSACSQKMAKQQEANTTADIAKAGFFGEKIEATNALSFDELMMKMVKSDSMEVKVRGTVEEVCQAKGCWMNISSENAQQSLFVKFKDYGFFVPKDIAGKDVVMEGKAYKEVTSVDELRHYASDAGKSKAEVEAITEPKEEYKFMASGVIVLE